MRVVLSHADDMRLCVSYGTIACAFITAFIQPIEYTLCDRVRYRIVEVTELLIVVSMRLLEVSHEVTPGPLDLYLSEIAGLRQHQQVGLVVEETPVYIRNNDILANIEWGIRITYKQRLYLFKS